MNDDKYPTVTEALGIIALMAIVCIIGVATWGK
jgi:hypothetical protein